MSKLPTTLLKLGKKELNLRFDTTAIMLLDQRGLNLYDPRTYHNFSPTQLRSLVWAGQLHEKDSLTESDVTKLFPTALSEHLRIAEIVANAIKAALYAKDTDSE